MTKSMPSSGISNIEVLTGTAGIVIPPNVKTSTDVGILLKFVRRVNEGDGVDTRNEFVIKLSCPFYEGFKIGHDLSRSKIRG